VITRGVIEQESSLRDCVCDAPKLNVVYMWQHGKTMSSSPILVDSNTNFGAYHYQVIEFACYKQTTDHLPFSFEGTGYGPESLVSIYIARLQELRRLQFHLDQGVFKRIVLVQVQCLEKQEQCLRLKNRTLKMKLILKMFYTCRIFL